jgi:hypothetical protein
MGECKKASSTFTWPCVTVLKHVKVNVYIILLVQSILIRCGYILMWVHPKTQCFYYNRPLWPFMSNYNVINVPQVKVFTSNTILWKWLCFNSGKNLHFWAKDIGQIVVLLENILGVYVWLHVAPCHCLSKISILNLLHHHFWSRLLQELEYLL